MEKTREFFHENGYAKITSLLPSELLVRINKLLDTKFPLNIAKIFRLVAKFPSAIFDKN